MLGVEQCAACTTVHGVRGAGPAQPLSKEFLLLSQTLQGVPPDSQALGVASIL